MSKYDDIIDHPHYQSKTRPHMSMLNRAAQFAPFAALSGYEEAINEAGRTTDRRIEPDESEKSGGSYETITGSVKNIDAVFCYVVMEDGTLIAIKDIFAIEI